MLDVECLKCIVDLVRFLRVCSVNPAGAINNSVKKVVGFFVFFNLLLDAVSEVGEVANQSIVQFVKSNISSPNIFLMQLACCNLLCQHILLVIGAEQMGIAERMQLDSYRVKKYLLRLMTK